MSISVILRPSSTNNIASDQLRMDALEQSLGSLDLSVPIPEVKNAEVLANPLDVYRTYLAQVLADAVGCDIDVAYKSIQWPNNIFNGDLAVILPKLRPGAKALTTLHPTVSMCAMDIYCFAPALRCILCGCCIHYLNDVADRIHSIYILTIFCMATLSSNSDNTCRDIPGHLCPGLVATVRYMC